MTNGAGSIVTNAGGPGDGLLGFAWVDGGREGTPPRSRRSPPEAHGFLEGGQSRAVSAIIGDVIETAQLIFHRPSRYRNVLRTYCLYVDGARCGKLRDGRTLQVTIPAGTHWVRARVDWAGSPRVEFEAPAGGEIHFAVEPAGSLLTMWWQMFGTTTALRLTKAP